MAAVTTKFSLNCDYYHKEFESLDDLLEDISLSGMDPNYAITINGRVTEDIAWDLMKEWN